ncbi:hypothetical protein [Cellulosilyticum sp. WCF-2]|uniref:hypothetical protein n=1 Tax=Cellulosilyticum sp. WCF-2 TaxID=2497860 RepID=UPI000F8CFA6A|nr:hypothetical protein [Cellulosilyticum sp. WCF-2]QEH70508.1 hypothetical protein EKH84_19720 [Cellulosilyticum sp. WCF-2]
MPSLTELNQAYIKAKHEAEAETVKEKAPVVTIEAFKKMSLREQNMLYIEHPEVYKGCWKEIHADDL